MKFQEIISALNSERETPIKPEKIIKILRGGLVKDHLVFIGVDLDTKVLKGKFVRKVYETVPTKYVLRPYEHDDSDIVTKIYYARNQEDDWKRLTVIKELLHIVDPDRIRFSNHDEVRTLVSHLSQPMIHIFSQKAEGSNGDNFSSMIDYLADMRAVIAMVPEPIRLLACKKLEDGKITVPELAELFGIPLEYMSVVVSSVWTKIRDIWVRF